MWDSSLFFSREIEFSPVYPQITQIAQIFWGTGQHHTQAHKCDGRNGAGEDRAMEELGWHR